MRGKLLIMRCDQPDGGLVSTMVPGAMESAGRATRSYVAGKSRRSPGEADSPGDRSVVSYCWDQSGVTGGAGQVAQTTLAATSPTTSAPATIHKPRRATVHLLYAPFGHAGMVRSVAMRFHPRQPNYFEIATCPANAIG